MKVAIVGAGICGAYLYRLLQDRGYDIHLYDRPSKVRCGLTPCAWGVSPAFNALLAATGLDSAAYLLCSFDHLYMDEVRVEADLMTIDKPRLVRDLRMGAEVRLTPVVVQNYDRVIDASGTARALLPPLSDDKVLECSQFLVRNEQPLPGRVQLGGVGYAWSLPLGADLYHVGCGSLLLNPQEHLERLGWLGVNDEDRPHILCRCRGNIRLTGPRQAQPFVVNRQGTEIWGVGEAIGCVAPLAGEGIVPGLQSVQLLLKYWDDAERYRQALLADFRWMEEERVIVERLRRGQAIGLQQARILRRNSRRMGIQVGLREAITLLQRMGSCPGSHPSDLS